MIPADFAERVAGRAYASALAFFQPSPEWRITLARQTIDEEEVPAQCWTKQNYHRAQIVYDPAQCEDGAELWRVIGHEVAHLLHSEYIVVEIHAPKHLQGFLEHAGERLATRLENLFLRERPYPGDAEFGGGPAP